LYRERTIAVVIPAYNEEAQIRRVLETMPSFVDHCIVVDDCSTDETVLTVEAYMYEHNRHVVLLRHEKNQGVGGAIVTGYEWARDNAIDATVVMAGDAQMDPEDLPAILDPVVQDRADYAKGNRLFTGDAWKEIPHLRYLGNAALSLLTKIASGYWHVADSQTGYTAISLRMLKSVNWESTYKRYGCPNDYLVRLNVCNARVVDVPIKPVYNVGEKSGIRLARDIPKLAGLLLRLFLWRMLHKYVIRDFHPLVFFYSAGLLTGIIATALLVRLVVLWVAQGFVPQTTALALAFFALISLQFTMFAMWFDMEANKHLGD